MSLFATMTMVRVGFFLLLGLSWTTTTEGFVPQGPNSVSRSFLPRRQRSAKTVRTVLSHPETSMAKESSETSTSSLIGSGVDSHASQEPHSQIQAVRAPLKFIGPYPCVGLIFPNLATSSQRKRNVTGVSLDFVLDTAANTNTINAQVAKELDLSVVGEALPGMGAGGAIRGGTTFMLGDVQLEGLQSDPEEQFTFMQGLTASALPVASPAAAGLLSLSFFRCFEGGVEFQWGNEKQLQVGDTTTTAVLPSVTFYGDGASDSLIQEMTKVSVKELPVTSLPSVVVRINGVEIPALLDTGSPITVINSQAAEQAGIKTVEIPGERDPQTKSANPIASIAGRLRKAQAAAQSAARGDFLTIAGTTGERIDLIKSEAPAEISLDGETDNGRGDTIVKFGQSCIYVGNLPGLAALNAVGDESPPAAVLGMDILRMRPKMLFKAKDGAIYF